MLKAALKEGYFGLFRFGGRMALGPFWIYAGVNMLLAFIATAFAFDPVFKKMAADTARIAREHPEDVTITQGPGHYSVQIRGNHGEIMPDLEYLVGGMVAISAVFFLLMAAAAVRRLHDSNRNGIWVILPVPFLMAGLILMPRLAEQIQQSAGSPDVRPFMGPFLLLMANNALYLLSILILMVLFALSGSQGANRFGEPPKGKS